MDATFIIDKDYDSFGEGLADVRRLLSITGDLQEVKVEPLRITFQAVSGLPWLENSTPKPTFIGWHFNGAADDRFLEGLGKQLGRLVETRTRFRVSTTEEGKPEGIELRYDPDGEPHIAIPFEDSASNALRFFSRLRKPLAAHHRVSETSFDRALKDFCAHAESTLAASSPFPISLGGTLFRRASGKSFWTAIPGRVGRHEIFKELQIRHSERDFQWLAGLVAVLESHIAMRPLPLFLQFFSPLFTKADLTLPESDLLDVTMNYSSLSWIGADEILNAVTSDEALLASVKDTYILFEQPSARIDQKCGATYILRRARNGTFEIRVYATWDKNLDPESAVAPIEAKCGLVWAHME